MKDSKSVQKEKVRKLKLKKNTVRVLDDNRAKAVIGGLMADPKDPCTCTCKNTTLRSTLCCK